MSDRERIALYLSRHDDPDEFLLFGSAHINMRGTFKRETIKDAVQLYRRTGEAPPYVTEYLDSMN